MAVRLATLDDPEDTLANCYRRLCGIRGCECDGGAGGSKSSRQISSARRSGCSCTICRRAGQYKRTRGSSIVNAPYDLHWLSLSPTRRAGPSVGRQDHRSRTLVCKLCQPPPSIVSDRVLTRALNPCQRSRELADEHKAS